MAIKWHFEDDFPFPKVGYVNPLEGTHVAGRQKSQPLKNSRFFQVNLLADFIHLEFESCSEELEFLGGPN